VAQVGGLGSKVGGHLAPFCIDHMNQVNSHNGSAVMTAIIIIIIITDK